MKNETLRTLRLLGHLPMNITTKSCNRKSFMLPARLIVSLILICFWSTSNGQSKHFDAGLTTGIITSQIDGDGNGGYHKFGFNGGIFTSLEFKADMTGMFELKYAQKGSATSFAKPGSYNWRIRIGMIEAPFTFKYKFGKFTYEAGLSYGRIISTYEADTYGATTILETYKKGVLEGHAGINFDLKENLVANWRYSRSLTPVAGTRILDKTFLGLFGGAYNSVLSFSVYYFLKKS